MTVRQLPSELMLTSLTIKNYYRAYSSESMSGIIQSRDSGIQWFSGELTLQAYGYNHIRILNGFLAGLKGRLNKFELPLKGAYAQPDLATLPYINGAHAIATKNVKFIYENGALLVAGSVFNLPNDSKLYTLMDDMNGNGTYEVIPALKRQHAHLEQANFRTPKLLALLDDNETTVTTEAGGILASVTLGWREIV